MTDFPIHPYPWQLDLWQQLEQQHRQQRLPHALLLAGPKGLGKHHFALAFGQYILCSAPVESLACGQCKSCLLNKVGNHPDFMVLEPEESSRVIKVDQVREAIDQLNKTSQQGGYKFLVLNPAENMNLNAANALLKSLEEPSDKVVMILISHSLSQLLPTIRSRCQIRHLNLPAQTQTLEWLKPLLRAELPAMDLIQFSSGAPLKALALADGEAVEKRLRWKQQWESLSNGNLSAIELAAQWHKEDLVELLDWLLIVLHHWAKVASGMNEQKTSSLMPNLSLLNSGDVEGKREIDSLLHRYIEKILATKKWVDSNNNPNKQLLLEEIFMDWVAFLRTKARKSNSAIKI